MGWSQAVESALLGRARGDVHRRHQKQVTAIRVDVSAGVGDLGTSSGSRDVYGRLGFGGAMGRLTRLGFPGPVINRWFLESLVNHWLTLKRWVNGALFDHECKWLNQVTSSTDKHHAKGGSKTDHSCCNQSGMVHQLLLYTCDFLFSWTIVIYLWLMLSLVIVQYVKYIYICIIRACYQ